MTDFQMRMLTEKVGDAFYLLESEQFRTNFEELKSEFTGI